MKKTLLAILLLVILSGIWFVFLYYRSSLLSVYFPIKAAPAVVKKQTQPNNVVNKKLFYGVSIDISQIAPSSKGYILNNSGMDLIDMAHALGVNMIRITNAASTSPNHDSYYSQSDWNHVLNKMNSFGIKAIILVETPALNPNDFSQNYLDLVENYVVNRKIPQNPAVYAIDIRNEPALNPTSLASLKKAEELIKTAYPSTLVTVGGWKILNPNGPQNNDPYVWGTAEGAQKLASIVDFYSLHVYGYDQKKFNLYPDAYSLTTFMVSKIKDVAAGKPLLIEEFGAGNGSATTDQGTTGSPELQASVYDGVYHALEDYKNEDNLLGSVAYVFYPRDKYTAGWNILDDHGNYRYPAADVLQKFASKQ